MFSPMLHENTFGAPVAKHEHEYGEHLLNPALKMIQFTLAHI